MRIYDYVRADFDAIKRSLCLFLNFYVASFDGRSVGSNLSLFKEKVASFMSTHVPLRTISSSPKSSWFNMFLKRLSNKEKRIFHAAEFSDNEQRWIAYHTAAGVYKKSSS